MNICKDKTNLILKNRDRQIKKEKTIKEEVHFSLENSMDKHKFFSFYLINKCNYYLIN